MDWNQYVEAVERPLEDLPTAVDVALCYGWIDGVRKGIDGTSSTNRFTPRKAGSIWSRVNIARVERLIARGEMHPSGMEAYGRRDPAKSEMLGQTGAITTPTRKTRTRPRKTGR